MTSYLLVMTSISSVMTSISTVMTSSSNVMTSFLNVMTCTGHKTTDQSWSWTDHDQLVISFTRPGLLKSKR
jgi:hypothetical protein